MPDEKDPLNNKINRLAAMIDGEVHRHYKLWPNNYIAFDILNKSQRYQSHYSSAEKQEFIKYMENETRSIEGDREKIEKLFLEIYSNPLVNADRNK
jgi:hypothetical protein